ncbi:hypothetical protein PROVRETT_10102 [Providencia rettgeri DSM 1131]|nr:hypothetical protein PROVRETT_10102 [Providencia rettgeri DSM 1131]
MISCPVWLVRGSGYLRQYSVWLLRFTKVALLIYQTQKRKKK